jgi:hypothetical protein
MFMEENKLLALLRFEAEDVILTTNIAQITSTALQVLSPRYSDILFLGGGNDVCEDKPLDVVF